MAPNGWTTPEERDFLRSFLPEYEACQVKRRYKAFWQRLNVDYFAKFPVSEKLFPGIETNMLDKDQKALLAESITKQQQRLKEWFRWQMNPRSRNAGFTLSKKDLHIIYNGRTRVSKPYEVFARLYPTTVEDLKKSRCELQGITGRKQLTVWHEVAKELYENATQEQIDTVKREMEGDGDEVEQTNTAKTYQRYFKKLPTILDATITPAVRQAGVLAVVTIVGPDPERNGKIVTKTLQFGDKPETPVFSKVWADHDSVFVEELARFARRHEFPPEVCASRSLAQTFATEDPPSTSPAENSNSNADTPNLGPIGSSRDAHVSGAQVEAPLDPAPSPTPSVARSGGAEPNDSDTEAQGKKQMFVKRRNRVAMSRRVESDDNEDSGVPSDDNDDNDNEDFDGRYGFFGTEKEWRLSKEEWEEFDAKIQAAAATFEARKKQAPGSPSSNPPAEAHRSASQSTKPQFSSMGSQVPAQASSIRSRPLTSSVETSRSSEKGSGSTHVPRAPNRSTPLSSSAAPAQPTRAATFFTNLVLGSQNVNANSAQTTTTSSSIQAPLSIGPSASNRPQAPSSGNSALPSFASSNPFLTGSRSTHIGSTFSFGTPGPRSNLPSTGETSSLWPRTSATPLSTSPPESQGAPLTRQLTHSDPFISSFFTGGAHPLPPPPTTIASTLNPNPANLSETQPSSASNPNPPPHTRFLGQTGDLGGNSRHKGLPTSPAPSEERSPSPPVSPKGTSPPPPPALKSKAARPQKAKPAPEPVSPVPTRRRSARESVPSKRQAQLQLIGTNAPQASLAVEKPGVGSEAPWFIAAIENLNTYSLGEECAEMISKWETFENSMREHKSKASLPASERPVEWSKWTAKSWQGVRRYDKVPSIDSPAELGIAITKWWSSIQPSFRASHGIFPLPIFSDPSPEVDDFHSWSCLRKPGPNGFVSVIMLLVWWGQAAMEDRSEWEDDSLPAWKHMVTDVSCVLDELIRTADNSASITLGKRPSDKENDIVSPSSKRARV